MTAFYDRSILVVVSLLILIGLTGVYSSTSVISPDVMEKQAGKQSTLSQFHYVKKQVFTAILGLLALIAASRLPLETIKKLVIPLLVISLIGVLLVFTPLGVRAGGARRWLRLWPSAFQPSELVKLSVVLFLAWYASSEHFRKDSVASFVIPIGVMVVFQGIFIKQPDFGAVMSLGIITMFLLFLAGTRMRYLLCLSGAALPVVVMLAMKPYRLKRILAFLDPWADPQGSGFQLIQSYIALGSGGVAGIGLGEGKQKLAFLPEAHTDFIFSIIGEEVGLIGAIAVVILFLFLFLRGVAIARGAKDPNDLFAYYLAFGISIMIALQAAINFAVVTGMVPTKGLPLPFISYGGSSLIVSMTAIGLLLNVSRRTATVGEALGADAIGKGAGDNTPAPAMGQIPATSPLRWDRGFGYSRYRRSTPAGKDHPEDDR